MINVHSYGERNAYFHFKAKDTPDLFKCMTCLLYHQFQPNNTHLLVAQIQTRHTSLCQNGILHRTKLMKSQAQQSKPCSLPGYTLQSCGLVKGSMCVWKHTSLWLCWSGDNAEASQDPLADQSCSTGSKSTTEKPLRRHHLSSTPKRFFELFTSTDASTANPSSCLGLQYF